jgi:hypothetical protein
VALVEVADIFQVGLVEAAVLVVEVQVVLL